MRRSVFSSEGLSSRGKDRPEYVDQLRRNAHRAEGPLGLGAGVSDLSRAENPVPLLASHAAFPTASSTTSSLSPTSRAALMAT